MLLVEVNISKIAFFIAAQNFSQVVTKFITCDDVTRFDGISATEQWSRIRKSLLSLWVLTNKIATAPPAPQQTIHHAMFFDFEKHFFPKG